MFESHPYVIRVLLKEHLAEPYVAAHRAAARRVAKRSQREHENHRPPAA